MLPLIRRGCFRYAGDVERYSLRYAAAAYYLILVRCHAHYVAAFSPCFFFFFFFRRHAYADILYAPLPLLIR